MSDESRVMAALPSPLSEEKIALQQSLLESARLFARDVLRFSHDWQIRWNDPAMTLELAEIGESLLVPLAGLEQEFSRPEGPSEPQAAGFLGMLLGTPGAPGPLTRLKTLTGDDPAEMSLADQRLLSETDTLYIQLNGFRAQWQDYLSLVTALERAGVHERARPLLPPLPPNRKTFRAAGAATFARRPAAGRQEAGMREFPSLGGAPQAPVQTAPPARQGGGLRRGLGGLLKGLLPFLALVVIVFLAYQVASRLPRAEGQATPIPAATAPAHPAPTATATLPPTATSVTTPTATAAAQPSPTAAPRPTPTTPAGGAQLSVNPPVLALPCPGTGGATLQLVNSGAIPFDWQATPASAVGGDAGILLDGASSERGHLSPGAVTQISVTAQTATAQGTITITYTGGANPVTVSYSVTC